MTEQLTEADIHQYHTQGYVILRRVVPTSLLSDLRRQAAVAVTIARRKDPNAQRLQPLLGHPEIDAKPFQDYANLAVLVEVVHTLAGPDAWIGGPDRAGLLLEPAERPWATQWHRDFGPTQKRVDLVEFRKLRVDPRFFHQINSPLYDDSCTWYVPGSHLRDDFPAEVHLTRDYPWRIGMDQTAMSVEEVERYCRDYVEKMPRALRLDLQAGDFCLYRNHGWHVGVYTPFQRRATIHDSVWTPPWKAAFERWAKGGMMTATPEPD